MSKDRGKLNCLSSYVKLIIEAGVKLEAKPTTVATAACIFHKFNENTDSIECYDLNLVAATSVYLAGKVEEDLLKIRDVINVFNSYGLLWHNNVKCDSIFNKDSSPLELSEHYWNLRDSILQCELLVLRLLKFEVSFNHPHKYLLHYWKSLSNWLENYDIEQVPILRTSWSFLTDYYLYPDCLTHKPQHVAIAALDLSLECYAVQVPHNDDAVLTWQQALCEDATKQNLWPIQSSFIQLYDKEVTSLR